MRVAWDTWSARLVDADNGTHHRGRYICPNPRCAKAVHWRHDDDRQNSFVHNPHVASADDCPLFYPSAHAHAGIPRDGEASPLSLYLAVVNPDAVTPAWHLELQIPPPGTAECTGLVQVPQGRMGRVSVPIAEVKAKRGYRVGVRPLGVEPYIVEMSGAVDPDYRRRLSVATPGLAVCHVNVFDAARESGRRLAEGTPLRWGSVYYVVWHARMALEWPASLDWRPLKPIGPWHCAAIHLPASPDIVLADWLTRISGRRTETVPLRPTLIAPVPQEITPDDVWVIPAGADVMVGVVIEQGSPFPTALHVEWASPPTSIDVPISRDRPIVSLGKAPAGYCVVSLAGSSHYTLTLLATADAGIRDVPAATLVTRRPEEVGDCAIPLYADLASKVLGDVLRGNADLRALHLPQRLIATIYSRRHGTETWHVQITQDATGAEAAHSASPSECDLGPQREEKALCQEILGLMRVAATEYRIEFDNFGAVHFDVPEPPTPPTVGDGPDILPEAVRQTAHWLLSLGELPGTAGAPSTAAYALRRTLHTINATALNNRDRALLERVARRALWPALAEPFVYNLVRQVVRYAHVTAQPVEPTAAGSDRRMISRNEAVES